MTNINQDNFYDGTNANFTRCEIPTTTPDFESNSGSKYWYTESGVIRVSTHWGFGISSCNWHLDGKAYGYGMHPYKRDETGHIDRKATEYADGVSIEAARAEVDVPAAGYANWTDFEFNWED